jgi:hypothetical protein
VELEDSTELFIEKFLQGHQARWHLSQAAHEVSKYSY